MKNKRYAIVRVDDKCPVVLEEDICLVDRIKMFPCFNDKRLSCKNCRYGDTKEQLIMKVAQALERTIIDGIYVRFGKPITVEKLATDVIEFLGVE